MGLATGLRSPAMSPRKVMQGALDAASAHYQVRMNFKGRKWQRHTVVHEPLLWSLAARTMRTCTCMQSFYTCMHLRQTQAPCSAGPCGLSTCCFLNSMLQSLPCVHASMPPCMHAGSTYRGGPQHARSQ